MSESTHEPEPAEWGRIATHVCCGFAIGCFFGLLGTWSGLRPGTFSRFDPEWRTSFVLGIAFVLSGLSGWYGDELFHRSWRFMPRLVRHSRASRISCGALLALGSYMIVRAVHGHLTNW